MKLPKSQRRSRSKGKSLKKKDGQCLHGAIGSMRNVQTEQDKPEPEHFRRVKQA